MAPCVPGWMMLGRFVMRQSRRRPRAGHDRNNYSDASAPASHNWHIKHVGFTSQMQRDPEFCMIILLAMTKPIYAIIYIIIYARCDHGPADTRRCRPNRPRESLRNNDSVDQRTSERANISLLNTTRYFITQGLEQDENFLCIIMYDSRGLFKYIANHIRLFSKVNKAARVILDNTRGDEPEKDQRGQREDVWNQTLGQGKNDTKIT
eukprot:2920190-Pleurochrysis_carterae.AAC.2